ncbi:MAG: DUF4013 domain-containing protein [Methanobacterium sp.]|nr:DUF4013 domain-containing protein [Methanobacterium sp.]
MGIILVIGSIVGGLPNYLGFYNTTTMIIFSILAWLIGLFSSGYQLRILEFSIAGINELPNFDKWGELFINGIKYFLVGFIYFIPAIIIMVISVLALLASLAPYMADPNLLNSMTDPSVLLSNVAVEGIIGIFIALLYILIIFPVLAIALAHLAYTGEFKAAFRLKEILAKMSSIGWGNMLVWYIILVVMFLIISIVGGFIIDFISFLLGMGSVSTGRIINSILSSLILYPYLFIYIQRSIALAYISGDKEPQ